MIFLYKGLSLASFTPSVLPRHAAVDGEVDGVGGAYEDVDDENDLLGDFVIKQVQLETGWEII